MTTANWETVYINMNSRVLMNFKSKTLNPSAEQREVADHHYISRVYYHTLFLYVISKNRSYEVMRKNGRHEPQPVELTDYLKDVFDNNYARFLLQFGTKELMDALA